MIKRLQALLRVLLKFLFRVQLSGWEHYPHPEQRMLIIANHASFLDGVLLSAFLPDVPVFVINTRVARLWWVKPFIKLTRHIAIDPTNPLYMKVLIQHLKAKERVAIFPEGRITVTGGLMKVYEGPVLAADKADAVILPVHIDGAQYTLLSRLRGKVRRRLFPRIRMAMLAPRRLHAPAEMAGRRRRQWLGRQLSDLMDELMYTGVPVDRPLFDMVLEAKSIHGANRTIIEDIERQPFNYRQLITRSFILNELLQADSAGERYIGLLLPNSVAAVVTFLALQLSGRVPVILNFTAGYQGLWAACRTAGLKTIYTSRTFLENAKLEETATRLEQDFKLVFLEDLRNRITLTVKWRGFFQSLFPSWTYRYLAGPVTGDNEAVMVFTSGSEGTPKGVVLTHKNLLANRAQVNAVLDLVPSDIVLNALPLFHSFGLSTGTLLPILNGMRLFLYPTPLHYHIIPELAYELCATIMFGTNTFLRGYARSADAYDFFSMRLVVAGAEPLQEQTRKLWADKFGIRIIEGYGVTEASPVLAVNTPKHFRAGSVGRLMPGLAYYLKSVDGIGEGGRLCVHGANIMAGYRLYDSPQQLLPPATDRGKGWYDTGDIVTVDEAGFITILGRAKRFAKIGGEMISLATVEQLANTLWPEQQHAAINMLDSSKGEQIILLTTRHDAARQDLIVIARDLGVGEIAVPKRIIAVESIPLLGTGKLDYGGVRRLAESLIASQRISLKS